MAETSQSLVAKVTPEELRLAFSGPAFLSNKFYVTLVASGVRIAFTEQLGKDVEPQFRTAVLLSVQDTVALVQVIDSMLAPIREQLEASIPEAKRREASDG